MKNIEIKLELLYEGKLINAYITIVPDKDPIVAFAKLDFGILIIKGCVIKYKDFGNGRVLVFDLPAYKISFKYIKAVYFPNKDSYKVMTSKITDEIKEKLLDIKTGEEEIDYDNLPF